VLDSCFCRKKERKTRAYFPRRDGVFKVIPDAKFVLLKFIFRQFFEANSAMSFCTSKAWLRNKVKFVCPKPSNAAFVQSHEWENTCEQKPSGLKCH